MTFRLLAAIGAVLLSLSLSACAGSTTPGASIALDAAAISAQIREQLPSTIVFADRLGKAAVARLSTPLDVEDAPKVTEYERGDVGYWAPTQELYVFHTDGQAVPAEGLVLVGHVTEGLASLGACPQSCSIQVEISDATDWGEQ